MVSRAVLALILVAGTGARAAPPGAADAPTDLSMGDGDTSGPPAILPDPTAPTVGASLDRTDVAIGDRLSLSVSAVARADVAATVKLPDPLALAPFEVLETSRLDRDLGDGRFSRRFVLQVSPFDTGQLELPAIPLHYVSAAGEQRTVLTSPISVVVRSVIGDTRDPELQPLRPPRAVLVEDRRVWLALRVCGAGLGALAALGLGWLLVRRRRRRPRAVSLTPPLAPHAAALRRLAELRSGGDYGLHGYRPFYFALAEVLRAYLGARFGFDALELTTTELLTRLKHGGAPALEGRIAAFLEDSDLVKFARAPSTDVRALAHLAEVEALVLALRPAAAPPVAGATIEVSGG